MTIEHVFQVIFKAIIVMLVLLFLIDTNALLLITYLHAGFYWALALWGVFILPVQITMLLLWYGGAKQ